MNDDERKALAATIVDLVEAHGGTVTQFRDIDVLTYDRANDSYKLVIRLRGNPPTNLL